MAKYKEIVYAVLDQLHQYSDDARITEEHIIFLASRYRSFLLKQRYYSDLRKEIPESNYQTICVDLEETDTIDGIPCEGQMLRSTKELPSLLPFGTTRIYPNSSYFKGEINYVTADRMKYTGHNKWTQSIIYASLHPNRHLYLSSNNPQFMYLEGENKVSVTGIFENAEEASELACTKDGEKECDILDRDFPLEDALVMPVIELVIKELSPSMALPEDEANNANDDLQQKA